MTIHPCLYHLGGPWPLRFVAPNCQDFGRSWHIAWQSPVNHPHWVQLNHYYYHWVVGNLFSMEFEVNIILRATFWVFKLSDLETKNHGSRVKSIICQLEQPQPSSLKYAPMRLIHMKHLPTPFNKNPKSILRINQRNWKEPPWQKSLGCRKNTTSAFNGKTTMLHLTNFFLGGRFASSQVEVHMFHESHVSTSHPSWGNRILLPWCNRQYMWRPYMFAPMTILRGLGNCWGGSLMALSTVLSINWSHSTHELKRPKA